MQIPRPVEDEVARIRNPVIIEVETAEEEVIPPGFGQAADRAHKDAEMEGVWTYSEQGENALARPATQVWGNVVWLFPTIEIANRWAEKHNYTVMG